MSALGATTLSAEELDEVADDPEADLDDDEEAPVTRRRKRARQELEDTEDEEEVEAPRPGRRGRPLNPVVRILTHSGCDTYCMILVFDIIIDFRAQQPAATQDSRYLSRHTPTPPSSLSGYRKSLHS